MSNYSAYCYKFAYILFTPYRCSPNEDRSDVGMGEEWEHEPGTNCSGIPTRTELVQGLCQ